MGDNAVIIKRAPYCDRMLALDTLLIGEEEQEDDPNAASKAWWAAYVDGEMVGFSGLQVSKRKEGVTAVLLRTGVVETHRGRGIQKRLIKARLRHARKASAVRVITYTADWNLVSANNLIKSGYQLYRPRRAWGLPHALYFERKLK